MKFSDLLSSGRVRHRIDASSKKAVLEMLAEILATDIPTITSRDIFDCLVSREKLGSTGLGQGVAIPHGRIASIESPICAFMLLNKAVDFDAPDNEYVDLVFSLIVPEESTEEHLQILAGIAEQFSREGFPDALRRTSSAEELLGLINEGADHV
ncbi:MAG: PTS sugar transporter subunit IIA [Thiotrichales bacterium]|nr:PTS sugar transporter subunit IIA [Thiotrichales bacterium]